MSNDDEGKTPKFRLPKGKGGGKGAMREARHGSAILRYMHSIKLQSPTPKHARNKPKGKSTPVRRPGAARYMQRAAVRMTYSRNQVAGQWGAYGRYITRESATMVNPLGQAFDATGQAVNAPAVMSAWQKAGDEHVFKFILSPEFGDRMDLRSYTRDVVVALERDLGTKLQWVAADHYNTDQPHVHLAVRGRDETGHTLRIPREYVRQQLRVRTSEVATKHIGLRTELDAAEAFDRQIHQQRFTDLDRRLIRMANATPKAVVDLTSAIGARAARETKDMRLREIKRLTHLESMGLAKRVGAMQWTLDAGLENVLRQRQMADDRLKTLYQARQVLSDPRLQIVSTDLKDAGHVAGRLIGTGLDEQTDRAYMLVESTDGRVHYLYQPIGAQTARHEGLSVGSFVEVETKKTENEQQKPILKTRFRNHGDAEERLHDSKHLAGQVFAYVERTGGLPPVEPWSGWVGKYQAALRSRADELIARGAIVREPNGNYSVLKRERER
jgi:type IV secretory pathway VirD2 relaxase